MHTAIDELTRIANKIRAHAVRMVYHAHASHVGSCLSIADIVACLYWHTLRIDPERPDWEERDRLILSKGHAAAIVYAALAERGFFPVSDLEAYCDNGSPLIGHISNCVPGVEFSSGSLGHGLPVGCGVALAAKRAQSSFRTVVICSDGELDEGSNWEAILFAPRVKDVLNLDPLADKFRAFRWAVREVDGHNMQQLVDTLAAVPFEPGRPNVVIANTIKGKGVSFMEDNLAWHYKSPTAEQVTRALQELREDA
jgi:transketolase